MALLFNPAEAAFTRTALALVSYNAEQGVSLPTWGNPEREKLNRALESIHQLRPGVL